MKTQRLTRQDLPQAAELLRGGGLVGIPTETVYGLGANGLNPLAVQRIFQAKGRPQDNPLILHIPEAAWLERYCQNIPETAYALAEAFWPGPLTLVLPCKEGAVPAVVTAGLPTVGMRCPAHPVCRELIRLAGVPVAAPSGNTSGKPSPTTAAHMLADMDGKIDAIVDGGPCAVGVESTIVDLTGVPRLLRPGGVSLEELREVLGQVEVDPAVERAMGEGERPRAPGMKYRHYAPKAPVIVVKGPPERSARYIQDHLSRTPWDGVLCFDEYLSLFPGRPVEALGPAQDKAQQARRVFDALRAMDQTPVQRIWAQCPDPAGIGLAVTNRLNKAAGFHIVEA